MRILIKNGRIASHQKLFPADILINGEKILAVGLHLKDKGAEVVDASCFVILPGLVDTHVHLRDPGATEKEDFYTGTSAALSGGVTTLVDMPNNDPPTSTFESLKNKEEIASEKAVCDYAFYLGATQDNARLSFGVPNISGLKIFLGSSTGNLLISDFNVLRQHFLSFPKDKIIAIHGEDEEAIQSFKGSSPYGHNLNRPPICAVLALSKAIALAKITNHRLHVCHVSTLWEMELIKAAKNEGLRITCEVTPHHLFLTETDGLKLGNLGKMNPPLRSKEDVKGLWANMKFIDQIATDHAPHTLGNKDQDYDKAPSGVPGLETMLPLLLTAYQNGKITLPEIVRLTSFSPAKNFGFSKKGEIAGGKDADLVLVDFKKEYIIENKNLHTKCGWSPFAGWKMKGKVEKVFLRGSLVFDDGKILAVPGFGKPVRQTKRR